MFPGEIQKENERKEKKKKKRMTGDRESGRKGAARDKARLLS